MATLTRLLAPALLAAGLGFGAMAAVPAAHAQDDALTRVIVDVADVVLRGGQPYYRHGQYTPNDRLVVQRDRYGRPVYYRVVPRYSNAGPPYGNAYGYYRNNPGYDTRYDTRYATPSRRVSCSSSGNCTVKYYDPNYDRRGAYNAVPRYRGDRRWRDD